MNDRAYADGVIDGNMWDLDGFESPETAAAQADGWDTATLNAVGKTDCCKRWGVDENDDAAFAEACESPFYNAGVAAAVADRMSIS